MISKEVECSLNRLCALTIENLDPETTYEFQVQAKSKVGFATVLLDLSKAFDSIDY